MARYMPYHTTVFVEYKGFGRMVGFGGEVGIKCSSSGFF
jgi:hypothetical protein